MPERICTSYYENSVYEVDKAIKEANVGIEPDEDGLKKGNIEGYTLWMTDQIRSMDRKDIEAALKAARWIGYIFRLVEEKGYWDNQRSRELVREDVSENNHLPFDG